MTKIEWAHAGLGRGEALSAERLREALHYDFDTGTWTWISAPHSRVPIGSRAGSLDSKGYLRIGIDGREYRSHRLAWLYMTGEWPPHEIDHINLDKLDNRWRNLRLATGSQNQANKSLYSNNRSGAKGVGWHRRSRKWRAFIQKNGFQIHLGCFSAFEDARRAYEAAAEQLHGEFARTNR
ncbi:HNH endonuclease [Candidatus Parcubacteria bacterium]|nr:MAG: HNH endonuclease [Candidatus Parcubacteria bacterium]